MSKKEINPNANILNKFKKQLQLAIDNIDIMLSSNTPVNQEIHFNNVKMHMFEGHIYMRLVNDNLKETDYLNY